MKIAKDPIVIVPRPLTSNPKLRVALADGKDFALMILCSGKERATHVNLKIDTSDSKQPYPPMSRLLPFIPGGAKILGKGLSKTGEGIKYMLTAFFIERSTF